MAALTETAYKGGIFSGSNPVGQPPPAHAYRDGSLGSLSGTGCVGCMGVLGQPPPVRAYRDGSLGQETQPSAAQAPIAVAITLGAAALFALYLLTTAMPPSR